MMFKKLLIVILLAAVHHFAIAEARLESAEKDEINLGATALSTIENFKLNTDPKRNPSYDLGLRLIIDNAVYYVKPTLFMLKKRPDEVCTFDLDNYRSYRCVEGQPNVNGCHLMFFDAQGKWVGFHTMQIKEKFPHFCNAMPALGVANKANNELLVTMQYFIPEALQGLSVTPTGGGWFRMTSLFRVKAVNGKIEVEQDDACLGNPNRIDNIPEARKRLRQCGSAK